MSLIEERQRRILTTHVGSLPRPQSLSAKLFARMSGESYDPKALADELQQAVGDIVKKQVELGVDVISDGELSKTSFQYYVTDRLSGLERFTPKPGVRVDAREPRVSDVLQGRLAFRHAADALRLHRSAQICRAEAARGRHRQSQGRAERRVAGRRVHAVGVAVELRRPDGEPALSRRGGASLCGRRGAARGIPGDRRRGLHRADRRSAIGDELHAQSRD